MQRGLGRTILILTEQSQQNLQTATESVPLHLQSHTHTHTHKHTYQISCHSTILPVTAQRAASFLFLFHCAVKETGDNAHITYNNYTDVLMTSVTSRRPSAWWRHCSEMVFSDNYVIFRRRLKRIAFLESVDFSTYVYMQINFRDGHVTTFQHPSGCQMPGHRLPRLAKGTPSESRLSIRTISLG